MKIVLLNIKKHSVRLLMGIGALLGISACSSVRNNHGSPIEGVYGPPPNVKPTIEVIEDVYGPPVESNDTVDAPDEVQPQQPQNDA